MATYKEFQEALAADEELRARFAEISKELCTKGENEAPEAMSQVAAKLGFDVPASEFKPAMLAVQELDNEELDSVAGGIPLSSFPGMAERDSSSIPSLMEKKTAIAR